MSGSYKIELGVKLKDSDIQSQITDAQKTLKPIEIKVDAETKELTNTIKEALNSLSKGTKNALAIDTSKIEASLDKLSSIVIDIKTSLSTLDGKGMKDLLSSINQMATALGKAENESDSLVKSLTALSKKDFSLNIGIDMGKKNNNMIAYGRAARKQVIPELEAQIKYLENLFGGQQAAMNKLASQGSKVGFDIFTDFDDFNSESAIKKMEAMEKYINSLKKLATIDDIKLDGFNEVHKNASELINDITGVENAIDKASDVPEKIKNFFGGGIDAQGLSASLEPIVTDLNQIREAVVNLSKGVSLEGLTSSFDRLSNTVEKLVSNVTLAKSTLGSGLKNIAPSTPSVASIDDVIDKQVMKLMNEYAITGSKAFDEIRQSLVDFRNGTGDINKVTSAISNNMKVVNEAKDDYKDLAEYIKMFNASGAKVHIPDSIRQEYGDDYKSMRSQLGKGFTSGQGMDFETFITETNEILGQTIDLSHGAEAAFGDLVDKVNSTKGSKFLSGDDLFKNGILDMGDVVANVSTSLEQIENAEEEIARTSTATANTVSQSGERKQQSYKETSGVIENLKTTLQSMRLDRSSIDAIIKDIGELGFTAKDASVAMKNGNFDITVNGVDNIGRAITEIRHFDSATDEITGISRKISQSFTETDKFAKQQKNAVADLTNQINQLNRAATDQNANRPIKESSHLDSLKSKYQEIIAAIQRMGNTSSATFDDERNEVKRLISEYKSLKSEFKNAENISMDFKGADFSSGLEIAKNRLREFKADAKGFPQITQTVEQLDRAIEGVGDKSSLDKFNDQLRVAKSELKAVKSEVLSNNDNLATKIKIDIETEKFENKVSQLHTQLDQLTDVDGSLDKLRASIKQVDDAYEAMKTAAKSNDDESLVQAQKKFAAAIEKTNNELRIQTREQRAANNAAKLADSKVALKTDMLNWLQKNSKATKEYKAEIDRLIASLDKLNQAGVNGVRRKFNNIDRDAELKGLKGLNLLDSMKSKIKEYSVYFGAAEMFMYAEQGLRSMFEAVKEIDTAMTGLYRVTDLTASQYDTLFNDMISSAKKYGATLNDIINATTDWVRAGFEADTALGLAEVTTMYQHISDLDYDTAAENLITAYNGFKDELNGAFSGDTVSAVGYIADILNELDNNYAATSAGIGEALTRSASALDLAGNSIQETAGMITGIIEVTQDPEQAGSTLKILSLRLRGMKGQLEELGEETDENVENISKMQGQVLNLTKGKVNIFDGAGEFRSTYEIMRDIANVWDELNSTAQADLLETIAGKHRANSVAALLSNWKNVEAAVKSATEAEGSAARENAKYVDSIQGRLDKLTTAWQSFANTFMSSDLLKGAISGLTKFVEILEGLVDNFGLLGTTGLGVLGTGIFKYFTNFKKNFKGVADVIDTVNDAVDTMDNVGVAVANVADVTADATGAMVNLGGATTKTTGVFKAFMKTPMGVASAIGLVIAAIGLAINAYKNYREEISRTRQEAIQEADTFLDSTSSFEQVYIKYSGKTNLTVDEENELKSAIDGTVDALGNKSSALRNVINGSKDYVASLERIKDAELKAAESAAIKKRDKAKLELKDAIKGWSNVDGSEVNVSIDSSEAEAIKIAEEMDSDFYDYTRYRKKVGKGKKTVHSRKFVLDGNADISQIIDYYDTLVDYQQKLSEAELTETDTYNNLTESIGKMSDMIAVYQDSVYEAVKAQYQGINGIPKTVDEYIKMRASILTNSEINTLSTDMQTAIANALDSQYGQIFDLTSNKTQAWSLYGLIKGYGDGSKDGTNEIGIVETFLNMRTAVNNNECSVGEYLAQFDEIDKMTANWSEEDKELLNTSFGIDTDSIKKQYEETSQYLQRLIPKVSEDYRGNSAFKSNAIRNIENFLKSLTADELAAVIDIRTEIDWENTSAEDIRKQIEDRVRLNKALSFEANIEADTTALETLNEILTESASAMGLSSDAIDSLTKKYSSLDSFDPSTLFEATGNGVKVNREELEKLEKEYNDLTKTKVKEHLDTLVDKYNDVTAEIDKCTNAGERAELLAERETYADKIEELATYQAQLEGVTGAYQDWINAQNTPEDYEGYEAVATGREDIESEIERGFIGNSTKKYIDLLSGEDLDGKSVDDYAEAWEKLDKKVTGAGYSVNDFFTVNDDGDITSTGIDRFFKSLQTDFEGSVAKFDDKTKKWTYDFGSENLEKIQEKWGIGIEAIELLLEAAASAGYDIDWDGILDGIDLDTSNFETLVSTAEAAQAAFNKLDGVEDVNFNFTATGVEEATSELEKARSTYIDLITNKDGTINLNAKGAEEMRVILATLLIQKQQLEDSNIAINIDTSGLDESQQDIANAINAVKNFREKYKNLEIAVTTGQGIEEAKTELNTAMTELQGLGDAGVDIAAELILGEGATAESLNSKVDAAISAVGSKDIKVGCKLDETALGTLNSQVLANFTPEATVKITGIDDSLVGEYTATEKTANGKVKWDNDTSLVVEFQSKTQKAKGIVDWANNVEKVKTKFSAAGTVKWTSGNNVKVKVISEANGTANANGTTSGRAFARGNWGIKGFGTALGGELGRELVVRDGKFFTIGDKGAEFFRYKKNDIVFNAAQTESLFKYGGIKGAKPRGTMLASGTAFAEGTSSSSERAFAWSATGTTSKFAQNRLQKVAIDGSKAKAKDNTSTKTQTKTKDNSVTTEVKTTWGANASESNFAKNRSESSTDENKEKDKKEFEETFDWIETAISRIEREIDNLDRTANSTYKSWSERNKALASEISKVSEEIKLQKDAASEYLKEANSVGLDETWAKKVRNGTLDIDTLNEKNASEELIEKIKNYQKWYNLYLDCTDAAEELREEESKLYAQRFENIQNQYDSILQGYEHTEIMLNEYISLAEAKGHIVSKEYYNALIANEKQNINTLKREQAELIAERDKAVAEGKIKKGSEAWYEQCEAIDEVTQAIEASNTKVIEFNNSIRDIEWEVFELIQERISDITSEADFLIELMSNEKLFDDNGKLTDKGMATMGLHGQNINTYMYQADDYGAKVKEIDGKIASGELDGASKDVIDKRREYVELQHEAILNAEQEKQAIKDLVSEGIEKELDSLSDLIDKTNEAIDSKKDLLDYEKQVSEQSAEIANLEKQRAAYLNDDSEESKAKLQEITVSLKEAKENLEETEFDRYITQQEQLLDELYLDYENILNVRLDDTNALISQIIDAVNIAAGAEGTIATALGAEGAIAKELVANGVTVKSTLEAEAKNVGTALSTAMKGIWSVDEGNAKSVITEYSKGFQDKQTTTNAVLGDIKADINRMVDDIDKDAQKKVTSNKTSTSAKKDPTKNTANNKSTTGNNNNKSTVDGKAEVGDKVKFISGKYYYDSQGKKPLGSKYRGKEVYITSINTKKWATHPYHISTGKKLGSGDLGWLKLDQLSGYATGAKNIDETQIAWTQEKGQEFIVRPSDGAILTPIAKGDSVLNARASNNIFDMANSPAEFIKDNLNLGATNVPNNSSVNNSISQNFENITFSLPNVKNYGELLTELQKDPKFDKLIKAMTIDQIAGRSSLAKNKSIR